MLASRPLLARLMAIALAIAGASSVAASAPQALRVWADPAGEVARNAAPVTPPSVRSARPARPAIRTPRLAAVDLRSVRPVASIGLKPRRDRIGSGGWPAADDGRQVLARKRSRLI